MQGTEPCVGDGYNFEAEPFERLLKERDVVARIGEPADYTRIGFIADQQCYALLGERGRMEQQKGQ